MVCPGSKGVKDTRRAGRVEQAAIINPERMPPIAQYLFP